MFAQIIPENIETIEGIKPISEWIYLLFGLAMAEIARGSVTLIKRAFASRNEKRGDKAAADIKDLDVEAKRIDTSSIKDTVMQKAIDDAYLRIDKMGEKMGELRDENTRLNEEVHLSNMRTDKIQREFAEEKTRLEEAIKSLKIRAEKAETSRDTYMNLLTKLVARCIVICPNENLSEYQNALDGVNKT